MAVRGLDHIVHTVRDLDRVADIYAQLGFTVTPTNKHAFGSENRIIQLDGFFIEILSIQKEFGPLAPHEGGFFSFARFNADFLTHREGPSMLVTQSMDRDADLAAMSDAGLNTHDPFGFSRIAHLPDGGTAEVGFKLGFVTTPELSDNAGFVCEQLSPEHFWKADFQRHDNGCRDIASVYVASRHADRVGAFFAGLAGGAPIEHNEDGVRVNTPRGTIDIGQGEAIAKQLGAPTPDHDGLFGMTITTADFDAAVDCAKTLPGAQISADRIIVLPNVLAGMLIVIAPHAN